MCGRFVSFNNKNMLAKKFNVSKINKFSKNSFNIKPLNNINIILKINNEYILDSYIWGYSFFNKESQKDKIIINSRIETINNKILFKESFLKRKCLVVANGYYEWKLKNNIKIPYYINLPKNELIYFAAIWRVEKKEGISRNVCCIITKESSSSISFVHHRMPVILSYNNAINYLGDNKNEFLKNQFSSDIEEHLDFYEVSKYVNNPMNDSQECIKIKKS